MNAGVKILLKVLAFVVSYAAVFALAVWGLSRFDSGTGNPTWIFWVTLIVLAVFGFVVTKYLPNLFFWGGSYGQGFILTIFFFVLKVLLSAFVGLLIGPWMIAKKIISFFPV